VLTPEYFGTLPFAFLSWMTYSVYLVAKLAVIFTSDIPAFMTKATVAEGEDEKWEDQS